MKIEMDLLIDFCKKVNCKNSIMECKFNFDESGINMKAMSNDNQFIVSGHFPKKNFKKYEVLGEIAIQDLNNFINFLKRFAGQSVHILKKENFLFFHTKNREGEYILSALEYIEDFKKDISKLEFDTTIKIDVKRIKEAYINAETVLSSKDIKYALLKNENDKLVIEVGEQNKIREIIEVVGIPKDLFCKFPEYLGYIAEILSDGEISISLKTNYPISIISKNEQMKINYIVAPSVESEEIKEKQNKKGEKMKKTNETKIDKSEEDEEEIIDNDVENDEEEEEEEEEI